MLAWPRIGRNGPDERDATIHRDDYRECGGYVALCPELDVAGGGRCALLANHGSHEVRRRGSHVVMQTTTPDSRITVPLHHKEIRIGTLQPVIRQSQLPRALFEVES